MARVKTITIAGGGLAGLSLGIALLQGDVPVVLHEAGTYPRHRVCGEFISGLTDEVAERLDISDTLSDALSHSTTSWFVRNHRILNATLPVAARSISRYRLDQRLQKKFISYGGQLHENSRLKPSSAEGMVWTAGRVAEKDSPWLGLKIHLRNLPVAQDLEMHAGGGAYVGITPIEDGYVNVCGLFKRRSDATGSGLALLIDYLRGARLTQLADHLSSAEPNTDSFTGISAFTFGRQSHAKDVCALGDAESMIPPFTGNGMTMAFESADTALPHLLDYAQNAAGWAETMHRIQSALHTRFKGRLRYANLLHPFLYTRPGQTTLSALAKTHLLPFGLLYRALR